MKILLAVPKHVRTTHVGASVAKAFKALGHRVEVFEYYETATDKFKNLLSVQRTPYIGLNERLKEAISTYQPHLFFALYGFYINSETLKFIRKKNVVTACWWLNDPIQFNMGLEFSGCYDFWFSNSTKCAERVQQEKQVKARFLPAAIDPVTYSPQKVNPYYACDVCFVGNWTEDREYVLRKLIDSSVDVKIYGNWRQHINKKSKVYKYLVSSDLSPEQLAGYFCSAKLVLNFHTWCGECQHGVNRYLFEVSGCGVPQVVDFKEELSSLYEPNREVIIYDNIELMPQVVRSALGDVNRLKKIGAAALAKTRSSHTYHIRMQQMLIFIFG